MGCRGCSSLLSCELLGLKASHVDRLSLHLVMTLLSVCLLLSSCSGLRHLSCLKLLLGHLLPGLLTMVMPHLLLVCHLSLNLSHPLWLSLPVLVYPLLLICNVLLGLILLVLAWLRRSNLCMLPILWRPLRVRHILIFVGHIKND